MSRRNASRQNNNGSKPAWVWFVLGNFTGGFAVFILFLNGLQNEGQAPGADKPRAAQTQPAEQESKPRFDFYTLLQENEVSVPPPKTAQPVRRRSAPGDSGPAESPAPTPVPVEPALVYILQAASFRDAAEAERLRAQLTLANLDVNVETATDSRGTWHRVLVGPYESRSRVAKAREILAEHQLMPLVLKRPNSR
ncbi:SPOR domain-containing protein [Microbulbifer guangxiensis]|uniref:SPOR domain-containing protein n=1 Tax=Microbulbifer guangxiensis TaxID=2904249 RepID=UPI001EFFBE12|nr:SPOR domain-containing protein [Microbulbifer guangxiensis]